MLILSALFQIHLGVIHLLFLIIALVFPFKAQLYPVSIYPSPVLSELFYLYCSYVSYLLCTVTSDWIPSTCFLLSSVFLLHILAFSVSVIMSILLCLVISHEKIYWTPVGGGVLSYWVFLPISRMFQSFKSTSGSSFTSVTRLPTYFQGHQTWRCDARFFCRTCLRRFALTRCFIS